MARTSIFNTLNSPQGLQDYARSDKTLSLSCPQGCTEEIYLDDKDEHRRVSGEMKGICGRPSKK